MSTDAGMGAGQAAASSPDMGAVAEQMAPNIPGTGAQQQKSGQGNPSWQELYDVMPSNLHQQMRPILEKWEQGVQSRFQSHADELKRYEPYKDIVDNNVPIDTIEQALAVAHLIDSDPQGFLGQLNAMFGDQDNGQYEQDYDQSGYENDDSDDQGTFDTQDYDLSQDPRFQQIQQQQDIIANFLAQQMQQEQEQQADNDLDDELNRIREEKGEFDERYVLTMAASGMPIDEAVQAYHDMVNNIRNGPRPDAGLPNIVSPSNGVPSEQIDVANLAEGDRKQLVMNILRQAAQNRG